MSGKILDSTFAAELASNVYDIKNELTRRAFNREYQNHFNMDEAKMAKGKTGALIVVKKTHVMAVMATGKGRYAGEAFVAIKGTASLLDALTDINAGVRFCHTGAPVHQGFYYAFDSILTELRQFISSLKGVSVIHCVGHSLGGAIATLAADWIKGSGHAASVKLYTFGSPRVGLEMFVSKSTSRLRADNIYRAYHKTDPVPMVPTWPFMHTPTYGTDYLIDSPLAPIPWEYHKMKHYITSAKKAGGWDGMKNNRPKGHLDSTIERWLQSDGVVPFSANSLSLLNAAMMYVIKNAVNAAGILIVTAGSSAFTLLDRMAIFLAKAAKVTVKPFIWAFHLVKKMAQLVGITVKAGTNLTVEFIRMVFIRLHQKIADMVWHAGREVG